MMFLTVTSAIIFVGFCAIALWYFINPSDVISLYRKPNFCDECNNIYYIKVCDHKYKSRKKDMWKFVLLFTLVVVFFSLAMTPIGDFILSFFDLNKSAGIGWFIRSFLFPAPFLISAALLVNHLLPPLR